LFSYGDIERVVTSFKKGLMIGNIPS